MANAKRIQKDLEALRDISAGSGEGTTRLSYTPAYRKGVEYLKEQMRAFGLIPHEDGVGNLYGDLMGQNPDAPKIISGSHLDTVHCSGYFDGQAGIICALEAARMLKESGEPLHSTFQVMATIMEEGARFPSLGGSRFAIGEHTEETMENTFDMDGVKLGDAIREYGLTGNLEETRRRPEDAKAFLELHMEQGLKLDQTGTDLGIVETIYGSRWFILTCHGATSHPSTPMDIRKDTALAAYKLITNIADIVARDYAGKATVTSGKMTLYPNDINAIPSRSQFSIDFRSGKLEHLDALETLMREQVRLIEKAYRVRFDIALHSAAPPTDNNPVLSKILEDSAEELGYSHMRMDSGAGHDAMIFAKIWNIAMLFVPSRGGYTHCRQEWTDYENLAKGADVLYHAVRKIDKL